MQTARGMRDDDAGRSGRPIGAMGEANWREIERVVRKRERWLRMINETPDMAAGMKICTDIMKMEIDNAKSALATMDATAVLGSLESLRGYSNDD